jgi:RNA polymerase sigma-70 factor (ECF subfamily)
MIEEGLPQNNVVPGGSPLQVKEEQEFALIYRSFQPSLYYQALGLTASREQAEDLVAEAFVKLWNSSSVFYHRNAIGAWLRTTVRNACLDWIKHQRVEAKHVDHLTQLRAGTEDEWQQEDVLAVLLDELYTAVQQLPERRKEVFILRYVKSLKNEEIAARLHISNQAVRDHLSRALRDLRLVLAEKPHLLLPFLLLLSRK